MRRRRLLWSAAAFAVVIGAASPAWAPFLRSSVPALAPGVVKATNHLIGPVGLTLSQTRGESLDPPVAGFVKTTLSADTNFISNNSALELITQGPSSFSTSATFASILYVSPDGPMPQDGAALPGVTVTVRDAPPEGINLRIGSTLYRIRSLDAATLQLARRNPGGDVLIDTPIKDR